MSARLAFDRVQVGDEIPALSKVVKREEVKAYADASGDQNPLHQDDDFARSVGFPGIIAHGMFTMAHLVKAVTDWTGDPGALKRMKVQFRAVVFMDETMVARGRVESLDPDSKRARLTVWVEVDRAGDRQLPIKNSEAEVELA
jgi:acyl dehydratase